MGTWDLEEKDADASNYDTCLAQPLCLQLEHRVGALTVERPRVDHMTKCHFRDATRIHKEHLLTPRAVSFFTVPAIIQMINVYVARGRHPTQDSPIRPSLTN